MILSECLPELGREVLVEIDKYSRTRDYLVNEPVVEQGQYLRFLPVVVEGNVKVYSHENAMEFLLYFISSGETCIFSFAHIFNETPIEFSAKAETDSKLLLLPIHKVQEWYTRYPKFNHLLLKGYQKHYNDLLLTTKQIICYNLEERLYSYLKKKSAIEKQSLVQISHLDISKDLGTSREVITRLLKKLSLDKKIEQVGRKIKIL